MLKLMKRYSLIALALSALMGCSHAPTAPKTNPYEQAPSNEKAAFKKVEIPLLPGTQFKISQGAFGCCTHNAPGYEYSWDFDVPYGTPVRSIEDGKVIQVWEPKVGGGCDKKFNDSAHNIKVLQSDGTVAQYVHIESKVKIGDRVQRDQVIAVTANNGFHCVPQLHFSIFQDRSHTPEAGSPKTIPLTFEGLPEGIAREGYTGKVVEERRLLEWPNAKLRGKIFDDIVSEIERLDGDGLLPRKNRSESWKQTTKRLRKLATEAKSWGELGHVFNMLDATYPNLHAHVFLAPELDWRQSEGRLTLAASIRTDTPKQGERPKTFRIGSVRAELLEKLPEKDRPAVKDEVLAINGKPVSYWENENFHFCKFPLREQCADDFFDNFRKEILSWDRKQPLQITLMRDQRKWTVELPFTSAAVKSTNNGSEVGADEPCGVVKDRYPDFKLVYHGYNACAFESERYPGTSLIRIRGFRYFDAKEGTKFKNTDDEVDAFWNEYWKGRSRNTKHVIFDVIENGGGDWVIPWYGLFFKEPFQEQYVSFKKIRELSDDPKVLEELFYREKSKHLWLDRLKSEGTWSKIPVGGFLPPVPQFCVFSKEDCSKGLFDPRDNGFTGDVKILVDQWCISSCVGFVWNMKDVLKDRVKFYGMPDSADSAYGRVYIDVYLDSSAKDGFRLQVSPRPGATLATLPQGAIARQAVSVTRSTDKNGKVISGIPMEMDGWVPQKYHYFDENWKTSVLKRALEDIR